MVKTHLLGRSVRESAAIRRHAAQLPKYTGAFEVIRPGTANTVVIRVPADIDTSQRRTVNIKNIKTADASVPLYASGPIGHDEHGEPLYAVDYILDDVLVDGTTYLLTKFKNYNVPELVHIDNLRPTPAP